MMDTEIIWSASRVSFFFREMQTKLTVGGDLSNKNFGVAPFRTKIDCAGKQFCERSHHRTRARTKTEQRYIVRMTLIKATEGTRRARAKSASCRGGSKCDLRSLLVTILLMGSLLPRARAYSGTCHSNCKTCDGDADDDCLSCDSSGTLPNYVPGTWYGGWCYECTENSHCGSGKACTGKKCIFENNMVLCCYVSNVNLGLPYDTGGTECKCHDGVCSYRADLVGTEPVSCTKLEGDDQDIYLDGCVDLIKDFADDQTCPTPKFLDKVKSKSKRKAKFEDDPTIVETVNDLADYMCDLAKDKISELATDLTGVDLAKEFENNVLNPLCKVVTKPLGGGGKKSGASRPLMTFVMFAACLPLLLGI